jgi:hypothetical protein
VGDAAHQVQVMADQQQRHAQARLQFLEQVEDLQLHGHVQRRGRLVGNQQFRLVGQGHGDHHRWRWPPDSSWGRALRRLRGSGMPTSSSSSRVRAVASLPVRPLCSRRIR